MTLSNYDLGKLHMWAAKGLAETCYLTYADQPSGLCPDEVLFVPGGVPWMEVMERWRKHGRRPPIPGLGKKEPVVIAKPIPALSRRQAAKAPEQVDSDMAEQFLLDRVEPEYPAAARKKRIQGLVILSALIDKEGRVEDLKVLSGNPELTDAAIAAVRQWKYTPFTKGNKTVPFQTQVKLSFALPN